MDLKELSAERMFILDFSAGAVIVRFVPLSMVELDADEIMNAMSEEWCVREKDCQYMLVSSDALVDDDTKASLNEEKCICSCGNEHMTPKLN